MIDENTEIRRGDIVVERAGYSMVLYDFYEVVDITAKQLKLIELEKKSCNHIDCMRFDVVPVKNTYRVNNDGEPEIIRVSKEKFRIRYSRYIEGEKYTEDHAD